MLNLFFLAASLIAAEPELTPDAKAWDQREIVIKDLAKELNKTLSRNSRAVRRGVENPRVEGLIQEIINRNNRRLKQRGAYLLVSQNGSTAEKKYNLTPHELDQAMTSMDPYRREFVESALIQRNLAGSMLTGRALSLVEIPEKFESKSFLDLEAYEKSGDRRFDELIRNFQRRSGNRYYALVLPKVDLLDASYSASDNFTVEQLKNGDINVYQERRRTRRADMMAIQIISQAPRNILFIGKDDLQKPLTQTTTIKSLVLDTFADTRSDLLSSMESDEELPAPPEAEAGEPGAGEPQPSSRYRQFDVKGE